MPSEVPAPYDRGRYNRALIANALLSPFNVVLLAILLIAGIVLGHLALMLPVAVVIYLAGAARTYFDEDAASKVLERERAEHRKRLEAGRVVRRPEDFAPPIRKLLEQARAREARIRDAITRAELPYDEVADEIDRFVAAMEATATRAQLLWEALSDTPPEQVEARIAQLRGDPAQAELVEALSTQLTTLQRMQKQLERFFSEMERILVELDTVRSQLVSVSASSESQQQTELAADVRALRERVGASAEGMAAAFEAGT
jgi:DNA repair exonuclease SbcCD ATPase subunit